ncbi:glucokinase [Pleosporales sp. CAS-2024a]
MPEHVPIVPWRLVNTLPADDCAGTTMPLCFPWLHRLGRVSKPVPSKLGDDECETVQVDQAKRDATTIRYRHAADLANKVAREFELSDDDVRRITRGFVEQMNEGLHHHGKAIEQLPSFITHLPDGNERGTYLAVDMGGTNIRVCAVTFHGHGAYSMDQAKAAIPPTLMTTKNHRELFDWMASIVRAFVEKNHTNWKSASLDLGFTFSHAVEQKSINSGTLIRWSKGFDVDGVVGQDVCALLQQAFDALDLPIRVTALTNDTVGTLLAQAYTAPSRRRTVLGAVFGTGTNGAYIEKVSRITKGQVSNPDPEATMIINTEWGNFDQGLDFLSLTKYDRAIDTASVNPGFEMFEKQISGMYLGELLRLALLSLFQSQGPNDFNSIPVPKSSSLYVPWSLDTSLLSHLEGDNSPKLTASAARVRDWLGVAKIECKIVAAIKTIARAIVRRSARLSAVALGAVLIQTGCLEHEGSREAGVCIGVDGSLIELYPGFVADIRCALRCIEQVGAAGEARVDICIAKDGSGVGAALAALIASKALKR